MKALHTATAALELGAGLALLAVPEVTAHILLGVSLESTAAVTVARVAGAGLFTLGIACWFARGDSRSPAARGLVVALLFYNVAAVAVFVYAALGFGLHGVALWPAAIVHAAMAAWCAVSLRPISKSPSTSPK